MSEDFDVEEAVAEYRRLIAERDSKPEGSVIWSVLDGKARYLRDSWKTWSGDDDLHETAFGEFVEE